MRIPSNKVMLKAETHTCLQTSHPFMWKVQSGPNTYDVQILEDTPLLEGYQLSCTCDYGKNAGPGNPGCSHAIAVLMAIKERLDRDMEFLDLI